MDIATFKFYIKMILSIILFFSFLIFIYYLYILVLKIKNKENKSSIINSISSHLGYFSAIIFFIYQTVKDNTYIDINSYFLLFIFSIIILLGYAIYIFILHYLIKLITNSITPRIIAIIHNNNIIKQINTFRLFVILLLLFIIILILTRI